MPDDDPPTEDLREQQAHREQVELQEAAEAVTPEEEAAHLRRAEKAGYLQAKLAERERSEERARGKAQETG